MALATLGAEFTTMYVFTDVAGAAIGSRICSIRLGQMTGIAGQRLMTPGKGITRKFQVIKLPDIPAIG